MPLPLALGAGAGVEAFRKELSHPVIGKKVTTIATGKKGETIITETSFNVRAWELALAALGAGGLYLLLTQPPVFGKSPIDSGVDLLGLGLKVGTGPLGMLLPQ